MAKPHHFHKEDVYDLVSLIPPGKVTSYGAIARALGFPQGARLVGYSLYHSATRSIPAHRVVNRQGILTGEHHWPNGLMKELLQSEGVIFINQHQVCMKTCGLGSHFINTLTSQLYS